MMYSKTDKSNFGSMDQLAQSAKFYFLNSLFNQKSKSVKMCKKIFLHKIEPIEPIELKLDFSFQNKVEQV